MAAMVDMSPARMSFREAASIWCPVILAVRYGLHPPVASEAPPCPVHKPGACPSSNNVHHHRD
jgi:hypothetical protein